MFDKFGEMSSYKEINTLAENLFNEGDVKSLHRAKQNVNYPRPKGHGLVTAQSY